MVEIYISQDNKDLIRQKNLSKELFDFLFKTAISYDLSDYKGVQELLSFSVPDEYKDRVEGQVTAWINRRVKRAS